MQIQTYDINVEKEILGAILVDNDMIVKTRPILEIEDFYYKKHRILYEIMCALHDDKAPLDPVSIVNYAGEGKTAENDLTELMYRLVEGTITTHATEHHSKIVKKLALLRKMIIENETLKSTALTGMNMNDVLESAKDITNELYLEYIALDEKTESTEDITNELLNELEHPESVKVYQTGIYLLDDIITGFRDDEFIIICGDTSHGKTALAGQIAYNFLMNDKKVLWFSLEMRASAIYSRFVSLHSKVTGSTYPVPIRDFVNPTIKDIEKKHLIKDLSKKIGENIIFNCFEGSTVASIESLLEKNKNIDLVVIDYMQLLTGKKAEKRYLILEQISRELKILTGKRRVPIIGLSQLNKEGTTREAAGLECDADKVIRIYREYQVTKDIDKKNEAELIVKKNRNGAVGKVIAKFEPEYLFFSNEKIDTKKEVPIQQKELFNETDGDTPF